MEKEKTGVEDDEGGLVCPERTEEEVLETS